jgi:DNA-binding YbaB/EbfC family protein
MEMRGPMAQLMQQAQRMQENLKRAQEEIAKIEVTGQSGGGMVSVLMSGRHEVRRVNIDRKLFADDPEMAEDLVAAAINDAVNKVADASQRQMSEVTGGMNLPPGFQMPF